MAIWQNEADLILGFTAEQPIETLSPRLCKMALNIDDFGTEWDCNPWHYLQFAHIAFLFIELAQTERLDTYAGFRLKQVVDTVNANHLKFLEKRKAK